MTGPPIELTYLVFQFGDHIKALITCGCLLLIAKTAHGLVRAFKEGNTP